MDIMQQPNENITNLKGFKIDEKIMNIFFEEKLLELTNKEYYILKLFLLNPGIIFSREALLEKVWGYDYYGDSRAVDNQIRRLRKKIEADPENPKYILTKWAEGYYYKL